MLRPYYFCLTSTVLLSGRPTVRYQLNMYLMPSCIRHTSAVVAIFW